MQPSNHDRMNLVHPVAPVAALPQSMVTMQRASTSLWSPHFVSRTLNQLLPLSVQHFLRDRVALLKWFNKPTIIAFLLYAMLFRPLWLFRKLSHWYHHRQHIQRSLAYGPHPSHKLDVYATHRRAIIKSSSIPAQPTASDATHLIPNVIASASTQSLAPSSIAINIASRASPVPTLSPIVIFVHGGAWQSGDKEMYALMSAMDQQMQLITCILSYRTYPITDAFGQVEDLLLALSFVRRNALQWGGDANRIFLCGHSSGAHICTLAMSSRSAASPCFDGVIGFIGLAGVYDIAKHYEHETMRGVQEFSPMKPACGDYAGFAMHSPSLLVTQPLTNMTSFHKIPILLLHGTEDTTVPYTSSRELCDALHGVVLSEQTQFEQYVSSCKLVRREHSPHAHCTFALLPQVDHGSVVTDIMLDETSSVVTLLVGAFVSQVLDAALSNAVYLKPDIVLQAKL